MSEEWYRRGVFVLWFAACLCSMWAGADVGMRSSGWLSFVVNMGLILAAGVFTLFSPIEPTE